MDKDTLKIVSGGIIPETRLLFKNMQAVLEAAGSSFDKGKCVNLCSRKSYEGALLFQLYTCDTEQRSVKNSFKNTENFKYFHLTKSIFSQAPF